ncbi:MAG: c-type cytochrome, partial [Lentisphaerales bacterium]|nr:c-type cytochrome [Lentisphaerales bacterium]
GIDAKPDFSSAPKSIPVISNVGGGSKSSSEFKEGNLSYLSGEQSKSKITVPKDFKVELFADEKQFPELANPVQMQVDAKGRLWVACWGNYPAWKPGAPKRDYIIILEDTDKDGKADKKTVFAQIDNPLGFELWNGGAIVTSQPNLYFLKDTDGDDIADHQELILTGMGSADSHHAANNLRIGPDGGLYFQSGIFLVNNYETPWQSSIYTNGHDASAMFRFDPRFHTLAAIAPNIPNPHGTSFDRWGNLFAGDGTSGRQYHVRIHEDGFKMHHLKFTRTRPVPANAIISSENMPDDMQQNLLVCNTIGFLGLRRFDMQLDGGSLPYLKQTKHFKPGEAFGVRQEDFLESTDKNFRPTDAVVGADGAIYISDWHNVTIGHMQHNVRDPSRDKKHGRVFRVVYNKKPLQKDVKIHNASLEQLFENLKHPIDGVRHRSRIEMSKHETGKVIAYLDNWIKQFDPANEQHIHHLLEGLWTYQRRNVRNKDLLNKVLKSSVPYASRAAKVVEHFWTKFDTFSPDHNPVKLYDTDKVNIIRETPGYLTGEEKKTFESGAKIYSRESHCATCHQPFGEGLKGVYPPLARSKWVTADKDRLLKIILHGLYGKIKVRGVEYDPAKGVPPMTAFKDLLTDKEVADVATFIRNNWGNKASIVTEEEVRKVREQYQDKTTFWTPEELLGK